MEKISADPNQEWIQYLSKTTKEWGCLKPEVLGLMTSEN